MIYTSRADSTTYLYGLAIESQRQKRKREREKFPRNYVAAHACKIFSPN